MRSSNHAMFGSAAVRRNSSCAGRRMTPSSITNPRSSHQAVYWALPGAHVRMSRARIPARNRSASGPVIRYLYSGDESKTPAALRTAKYSNLSDIW